VDNRTATAIGYVCGNLTDIREHLAELGDTRLLDRVLAAIRAGDDVVPLLDRLHDVLVAGGDVLGVYGNASRTVRPLAVESDPGEDVFLCPDRRCVRYRWPSPDSDVPPACEVTGTPMVRERLR
jgi:hypothetical protein